MKKVVVPILLSLALLLAVACTATADDSGEPETLYGNKFLSEAYSLTNSQLATTFKYSLTTMNFTDSRNLFITFTPQVAGTCYFAITPTNTQMKIYVYDRTGQNVASYTSGQGAVYVVKWQLAQYEKVTFGVCAPGDYGHWAQGTLSLCFNDTHSPGLYSEITVEPTCVENGQRAHPCELCNYPTMLETVPATGHTPGEWVTETAPTATKTGLSVQRCTVCDTVINTKKIPALGYSLATPKITSISGNAGNVTVKWGAVSGAEKYRLFYKSDTGWKSLGDTTGTSMLCPKLKANVTYVFTVRCVSADGTEFTSNYDTKGTSYTVPVLSTPKLSTVTYDATGVTMKWGAVSGAAKYRVFYKTSGATSWKKIADTTSTSYTWKGAINGTKYTFTVRCVSSDGSIFTSNYDTIGKTITYTSKLNTPKLSKVTYDSTGVTLKWGAVSGAAKYRVFYKGDTGWKKIADTASTSYTWAAAAAGTTYTFTVRCVSADGSTFTSAYDTTGTRYMVPSGKLATPKLSNVTYDATGVTMKWGAVSGAAKYRVFYKTPGSTGWKKIADTTSTSYTWKGATNGTKYTFTVRCVSADGSTFTSDYDATGKTITYTTTLGTPKISGVSGTAGNVTIKWGAVAGAAKYRVFYKGDTGWKKIADTTSTSYTWTGATAGTYTFTVRCVTSDGSAFTSSYDTKGVTFATK